MKIQPLFCNNSVQICDRNTDMIKLPFYQMMILHVTTEYSPHNKNEPEIEHLNCSCLDGSVKADILKECNYFHFNKTEDLLYIL